MRKLNAAQADRLLAAYYEATRTKEGVSHAYVGRIRIAPQKGSCPRQIDIPSMSLTVEDGDEGRVVSVDIFYSARGSASSLVEPGSCTYEHGDALYRAAVDRARDVRRQLDDLLAARDRR